jgi:hypothetical protein
MQCNKPAIPAQVTLLTTGKVAYQCEPRPRWLPLYDQFIW